MADALLRLKKVLPGAAELRVVHRPTKGLAGVTALRPGVKALGPEGLLEELRG